MKVGDTENGSVESLDGWMDGWVKLFSPPCRVYTTLRMGCLCLRYMLMLIQKVSLVSMR